MFEQISLDYAFDALEPHIDALTMQTHYEKHHATYTKNLNALVTDDDMSSIEDILSNWNEGIPNAQGIRNNGGGFYNHNLYFGHLSPNGGGMPKGILAEQIQTHFNSFEVFKEMLTKLAIGQFGSGWAWLSTDAHGILHISGSPNQDNPILESSGTLYPIMGIDVWEHAYYLKYRNLRADYINAFFEIVNWTKVTENYANAIEHLK